MTTKRTLLTILACLAAIVLVLALVWPTPYRHTRWAGMESRVSRIRGEQTVHLPWTLAAGGDEAKTRAFCAECHAQKEMDLTKAHEHKLWVPVGPEPPAGKEGQALSEALAKALPPHVLRTVQVGKLEEGKPRVVKAEVRP